MIRVRNPPISGIRNVFWNTTEKNMDWDLECGIGKRDEWIKIWNAECRSAMTGLGIGIWNFATLKGDWEWNWNTENFMWNCIPILE